MNKSTDLLAIKVDNGVIRNLKDGEVASDRLMQMIAEANGHFTLESFCSSWKEKALKLDYDTLEIVDELEKLEGAE